MNSGADLESFLGILHPAGDDTASHPAGKPDRQRRAEPDAASLESLAVWPVITGLIFILRALGIAYNEVVVAILDERYSYPSLRRFATLLALVTYRAIVVQSRYAAFRFLVYADFSPAARTGRAGRKKLYGWRCLCRRLSVLQSWYPGRNFARASGHVRSPNR